MTRYEFYMLLIVLAAFVIAGIHGATDINYEMAMELSKHLKSLAEMYLEEPA